MILSLGFAHDFFRDYRKTYQQRVCIGSYEILHVIVKFPAHIYEKGLCIQKINLIHVEHINDLSIERCLEMRGVHTAIIELVLRKCG